MELSKKYFEQLGKAKVEKETRKKKNEISTQVVYQCQSCFTVYDKNYGDEKSGISAGTVFKDVQESYRCSVCDSPKGNFEKVELEINSL